MQKIFYCDSLLKMVKYKADLKLFLKMEKENSIVRQKKAFRKDQKFFFTYWENADF